MTSEMTTGRRALPLATRFMIAFVAAAVLPLVAVGTLQIVTGYSVQRTLAERLQQEAARGAANTIDAYLLQLKDQMTLTAREWSLRTQENRSILLDALLAYNVGFETLTVMDETGQEVDKTSRYDSYGPQDLANRARSPEFLSVMNGESYLGPIKFSQYGEPLATIAIPIRSARGEILGVFAAEVNLKYMWDIIARMDVGPGGYAYVIDKDGQLVAHRNSSLVLQGRNLSNLEGVGKALLNQDLLGSYPGLENQDVLGSYYPLGQADWFVLVETPTREALADVYLAVVISGVAILIALAVAALLGWYMTRTVVQPIRTLREGTAIIGGGDLAYRIDIRSRDEIGALANAFNAMSDRLRAMIGSLEQQVADRTQALERRAEQLQAAAAVGSAVASILETEELFVRVVELVRERFALYFVGLFLVDRESEWAVLQAGTGEAGQTMLVRGHRRRVGEGMVGWCIANAQARVAMDVQADAAYAVTAELPDTRAEAALPLRSRGQVLGALTVQSDQPGVFDRETIAVLQTMADQVAVALDNAILFAESQEALEASRRAYGEVSREAWSEMLGTRDEWGYRYARQAVAPIEGSWHPRMVQAAQDGQVKKGEDGGEASAVAVPLKIRDQVVGVLDFRKGEADGTWTEAEIELLEALTDQLGAALDSARLFQDSQRRAVHEQMVGQITRRVRETLDVDTVLRTVAEEMYSTLGLNEVVVRLATEAPTRLVAIAASLPLLPGKQPSSSRDAANAIRLALEDVDYRAGDFAVRLDLWDNSGPDDDVWRPELEKANAERAVADSDVLVYLGPTVSEGCKTSMPILNQGGLAQIEAGSTYPGLTKPGYEPGEPDIYYPTGERTFFRLPATDDRQGPAGAFWARDLGLERIHIVELDDVYGRELARTFREAAESVGLAIVGSSSVVIGHVGGFEEILAAIAEQQPDLIYYTGYETVGISLIRALRAAGITTAILGGDGLYVSIVIEDLMAYAEGIRVTFPGVSVTDLGESGQDFVQRFYHRFGYEPSGWAIMSYDGARLALAAIEKAGVADRAAVVQVLREIEFEGLLGRYSFDENGDSKLVLMSGVRVERGTWQSCGLLRLQ